MQWRVMSPVAALFLTAILMSGCGNLPGHQALQPSQPQPMSCAHGTTAVTENGNIRCLPVGSSAPAVSSQAQSSAHAHFVGNFEIVPGAGSEPAILKPIDRTLENPQRWTRVFSTDHFQYTANGVPFLLVPHHVTWGLTPSHIGETMWSYTITPLEHFSFLSQTQFVFAAARLQGEIAALASLSAGRVYTPPAIPSNALQSAPSSYSTDVSLALTNESGNTMTVVANASGAGAWYLNGQWIPTATGQIPSFAFMNWVRQTLNDAPYLSVTVAPSPSRSPATSSSGPIMPDLEGLSVTQAAPLVQNVNAHLGNATSIYSTEPIHTIINQSPQPYSSLNQSHAVTLTLSRGPSPASAKSLQNTTTVTWRIPQNTPPQSLLKVIVKDSAGNEEVFYRQVNPGQKIQIPVTWYGINGQLVIILNGQALPPQPLIAD